jgi:hypothetical protein
LTLVFWLLGSAAILSLFMKLAGVNPLANLCTRPRAEYLTECLGETVSPGGTTFDQMSALAEATITAKAHGTTIEQELRREGRNEHGQKLAVDPSKVLRRWTTDTYRSSLRLALAGFAGWTVLAWGLFYLIAWVASGFAGTSPPGS